MPSHPDTLNAQERSSLGAHYTPDALALELVAVALEPHLRPWMQDLRQIPAAEILKLRIIDPACGDGAILQAVVNALAPILCVALSVDGRNVSLADASALLQQCCLVGNDVDERAAGLARQRLPHATITCCDTLFDFRVPASSISTNSPIAYVGNPPFLGGGKISTLLGDAYRKRLVTEYPPFKGRGRADLCAAFLLQAAHEIEANEASGTISFIATNTISQGYTRLAGLKTLVDDGWVIWNAWPNRAWPGKAKVTVSLVHLLEERLAKQLRYT